MIFLLFCIIMFYLLSDTWKHVHNVFWSVTFTLSSFSQNPLMDSSQFPFPQHNVSINDLEISYNAPRSHLFPILPRRTPLSMHPAPGKNQVPSMLTMYSIKHTQTLSSQPLKEDRVFPHPPQSHLLWRTTFQLLYHGFKDSIPLLYVWIFFGGGRLHRNSQCFSFFSSSVLITYSM